jgi:hypothetical protein
MLQEKQEIKQRPANRRFAKKRVQWLIEHSTSHQLLCYLDSFELRNPLLRKAAIRVCLERLLRSSSQCCTKDGRRFELSES